MYYCLSKGWVLKLGSIYHLLCGYCVCFIGYVTPCVTWQHLIQYYSMRQMDTEGNSDRKTSFILSFLLKPVIYWDGKNRTPPSFGCLWYYCCSSTAQASTNNDIQIQYGGPRVWWQSRPSEIVTYSKVPNIEDYHWSSTRRDFEQKLYCSCSSQ